MTPLLNTIDAESWLKAFSFSTWQRIEFARTRGRLRIHETTITQTLLIDFRLISEQLNLPIEMFESVSEETNGNDFEVFVEVSKNTYVMFPCQAKIIYQPANNYPRIGHKVGEGAFHQIDLLVEYAERVGGFPSYIFYNFCNNEIWNEEIQGKIDFDIELFGCSLSSAQFIKDDFRIGQPGSRIPNFKDLHPKCAIPFHYIIRLTENKNALFNFVSGDSIDNLRVHSREELMDDIDWADLRSVPQIGKIAPEKSARDFERINENYPIGFRPKFRFIFSRRSRKKGTRITYIH